MIGVPPGSVALIALAGMTLYLASHNLLLWGTRRSARLQFWVAAWSGVALIQQLFRLLHYGAEDPMTAVLAMRWTCATIAVLGAVAVGAAHALAESTERSRVDRWLVISSLLMAALAVGTDALVLDSTRLHSDVLGHNFHWVDTGPFGWLWIPWGVGLLVRLARVVGLAEGVTAGERRLIACASVGYLIVGVHDNLVGLGVIDSPVLFDYSFAVMAIGFDGLAAGRFSRLHGRLEERVVARTAELEQAVGALRQAAQRARQESENKTRFLANTSHELRTPLNGLLATTELLLRSGLRPEQRGLADLAEGCGRALRDLVDGILDFEKIAAGRVLSVEEPFDLADAAEEATALSASPAAAAHITLSSRLPLAGLPVRADPVRVRQVCTNLLSNAVRHSRGGEITLVGRRVTRAEGPMIRVEVIDDGPGLGGLDVEALFDPFEQGPAPVEGGTGLGLAIVHATVEAMSGRVGAEDRPEGGARFWFELPEDVQAPAPTPAPTPSAGTAWVVCRAPRLRSAASRLLQEAGWSVFPCSHPPTDPKSAPKLVVLGPDQHDAARLPSLDAPPRVLRLARPDGSVARPGEHVVLLPFRRESLLDAARPCGPVLAAPAKQALPDLGARVLVVDDNPVNREVARLLLDNLGCRADLVSNGFEAVAAVLAERYDAVLMDLRMPGLDGPGATRRIRVVERASGRRTPIIALTAQAVTGERERCTEAGMDDFLVKPLSIEALSRCLSKHRLPANDPVDAEPVLPPALLSLWEEDARERVAGIERASAAGDLSALREAAHALAGAAGAVGLHRVMSAARTLERAAAEGTTGESERAVQALLALVDLSPRRPGISAA